MSASRRQFLTTSGASLLAGSLGRLYAQEPPNTSPPDLRATLLANGFNPDLPGSALLAVAADVHINLSEQGSPIDRLDDALVAELNELRPAPTHFAIAGDLICSNSLAVGSPRYPSHYAIARQEMQLFMGQLARFRQDLEVILMPGNHDTDNQDNHAGGIPALWNEVIARPPYQKRILGGVPVFFLDSGHAGNLGPVQAQWFASEAAQVSSDQEVIIVAHHPSFFSIAAETGLKRKVATAFAGHRAPVWVVGGHGHGFHETLYLDRGTRFIQLEVTAGTSKAWSDGNAAGYALLALQNGRLVTRMFRSLNPVNLWKGFQARKPLDQLIPTTLRWPFDRIHYPGELFEEGEYDRTGKVISFVGSDLLTHFGYFKQIIWKTDLSRFGGRIREFLVCASIGPSAIPTMTCSFSAVSANGPWVDFPFPANDGGAVFPVAIPLQFRSAAQLWVRVRTSMDRYDASISLAGWGLASAAEELSRYEQWTCRHYRTFLRNSLTHPNAKPTGSNWSNLQHFAFNIPLPPGTSSPDTPLTGTTAAIGGNSLAAEITGIPVYAKVPFECLNFKFARRKFEAGSMVSYTVECSGDLKNWQPVSAEQLVVTQLDADWEEVALAYPMTESSRYCRVNVTSLSPNGGQSTLMAGDHNGDGLDDLLQYAFDLRPGDSALRSYDPKRPVRKAGFPVHSLGEVMQSSYTYPRMRAEANSGVTYQIEESANARDWTEVPTTRVFERVIRTDGDWEMIEAIIPDAGLPRRFYRIRIELTETSATQ
jgi:hypothetical protein